MAIYLVRWPGLTASLVRAESEEHLVGILDQAANSDACEWSVYDSYPVVNGEVAGPNVTEAERTWIRACWLATGALRR